MQVERQLAAIHRVCLIVQACWERSRFRDILSGAIPVHKVLRADTNWSSNHGQGSVPFSRTVFGILGTLSLDGSSPLKFLIDNQCELNATLHSFLEIEEERNM